LPFLIYLRGNYPVHVLEIPKQYTKSLILISNNKINIMKKILAFILLCFSINTYSNNQKDTYLIKYQYNVLNTSENSRNNTAFYLLTDGENSFWFRSDADLTTESLISKQLTNTKVFYKDFRADSIYYMDKFVSGKKQAVKDLMIKNWEKSKGENSQNILNYDCNVATLKNRNNEFTAYYTKEISIFDGPWKFSGLPGLILKVYSSDGLFSWDAVSIIKVQNIITKDLIQGLIVKENFIEWEMFCKKYNVDYRNTLNYLKSQDSADNSDDVIKAYRPEIIIENVNR